METNIKANNAADLYLKAAERYGDLPAFASRVNALEWKPVSFNDLKEQGLNLATALIDLGVQAREHVGLFGDNRYEWVLADYGVQFCGAADVPRGSDINDEEMKYIINHAGIRIAFLETEALQEKALRLKAEMPSLETIISFNPEIKPREGVLHIYDLVEKGKKLRENGNNTTEERINGVKEDDLFTLIYTSGTTGKPKGVMLTHANMMSQLRSIPIKITFTDRVLSILPVWHVLERMIEVYCISCGACSYYTSRYTLREDLVNVEPTFMVSAPRLWENLYQRIMENVRCSHPVRRALFHIACFLGKQYHDSLFYLRNNYLKIRPVSPILHAILWLLNAVRYIIVIPWYGFFNATVLEAIRKSIGSSLKATISGGGALPLRIDRFFNYIGVPLLEGYGLTETSPVVCVRTMNNLIIGTVGKPISHTKVRIVNPDTEEVIYPDKSDPLGGRGKGGEIWVQGPQVMRGYYQEPELTQDALSDGWFKTGDIGMITFNDCLKVIGRRKSTIVLINGENVEPEPVEMQLMQSRFIESCMVTGQDQRYLGALIVLNKEEVSLAIKSEENNNDLANNPKVKKLIFNEIEKLINKSPDFKYYERVKSFCILPGSFKVGEELTNLFKVKRHVVEEKYKEEIKSMFEN